MADDRTSGINRRGFVTVATLGTAVAALTRPLSAALAGENQEAASSAPHLPADGEELTIAGLQAQMSSGQATSRSITDLYLARIAALDKRGPAINAIIELNPEATDIADALDRERKEKGVRGPLHGIPVLIKDNIDTADRMHTSAGSLALADNIALRDSFVA
ncbi:MAG: amidase family protein, partial [Acidobacteriota bacterium]